MKTITRKKFQSQYRLAKVEDYKFGMTYFTQGSLLGEVYPQQVKTTGNLAKDAAKFQDQVLRGEAYVASKSTSSKSTSTSKKSAPKKAAKKTAVKKVSKKSSAKKATRKKSSVAPASEGSQEQSPE